MRSRRVARWLCGVFLTVTCMFVAFSFRTGLREISSKNNKVRNLKTLSAGGFDHDDDGAAETAAFAGGHHQHRRHHREPEDDLVGGWNSIANADPQREVAKRDTSSSSRHGGGGGGVSLLATGAHRLVHLDLKGAPPKLAYYAELFPFVKRLGATGLLVEYEDMFPFWGPLHPIAAKNAYSRHEVEQLVRLARESQLEVIPLVQAFGHLEFVLKLPEFIPLREAPAFPQAICPSKNGSLDLVRHIIDQVMALHPNAKWLHVGCDEVFQIGVCQECVHRIHANGWNTFSGKHFLFLDHVRTVASYVRKTHNVQPIIWDDMLRTIGEHDLVRYLGNGVVDPMVWVYVSTIYRFVDAQVWRKYSRAFNTVWAAGAFKGAFGSTLFAVNSYRHLECTSEWMRVMATEGGSFRNGVAGYVLTGWQRYDHFATLCELLPAAVPSLAANLVMLQGSGRLEDSVLRNLTSQMTCTKRFRQPLLKKVAKNPYLWEYSRCRFPGQHFFRLLRTFKQLRSRVRAHVRTVTEEQAWLTAYNVRHNYSSPQRITEAIQWHTELIRSGEKLRDEIRAALSPIFDRHTIFEWLEQHIRPLLESLKKLDSDAHALMARESWPARPLPSDYDD